MKKALIIASIILALWTANSLFQPFVSVETRTVNVTDVWFMNSGIIVWGYWDNSTIEDNEGLFQSGFSHRDIGHVYTVSFKVWPNENIRCLKLVKKLNYISNK